MPQGPGAGAPGYAAGRDDLQVMSQEAGATADDKNADDNASAQVTRSPRSRSASRRKDKKLAGREAALPLSYNISLASREAKPKPDSEGREVSPLNTNSATRVETQISTNRSSNVRPTRVSSAGPSPPRMDKIRPAFESPSRSAAAEIAAASAAATSAATEALFKAELQADKIIHVENIASQTMQNAKYGFERTAQDFEVHARDVRNVEVVEARLEAE